jgi:molybdopterin molybdotransferase
MPWIAQWGGESRNLGILPDRSEVIAALADEKCDLLITIGGASVGDHDLVRSALGKKGFALDFWKIAMRPGKPLIFGHLGATPFLGLPGNPVSTLVCFTRYVLPALLGSLGHSALAAERIALGAPVTITPPLTHFLPVRLEQDDWGRAWAMPAPTNGSGDFTALAGTEGFVELPPGPNTYPKGHVTRFYRWS